MSAPPVKVVGRAYSPFVVASAITAGIAMLSAYAVLQAAHRLTTGEWLRGGVNPVTVVVDWVVDGAELSLLHALLSGVLVAVSLAGLYAVLRVLRRRHKGRTEVDDVARYLGSGSVFTETAVREHAASAGLTTGEVVGVPVAKVVQTNEWLWAGFRDGLTAMMGPGSGKTGAVVVTMGLDAPGACWVTSNRPDVAAAFYTSRSDKGRFWGFDPQKLAKLTPTFFWDPLSLIRAELEQGDTIATDLATQFADAGRAADAKQDAYFEPAGNTLLANFLLAAALESLPITQVLSWCALPANRRAHDILRDRDWHDAADQVKGVQDLNDQTRGSIYQSAANQIRFLKNRSALPWVQRMGPDDHRPEFDPVAFVRSGDTMVCLSREDSGSFGPIVAAMTGATIKAAEAYAASQPNGRLPIPMAMLLDEVANVCKLQALPDLTSHAGGRGIFIMPILQSPGQGKATWGPNGWDKLWGASIIRLIGRGIIDVPFLRDISEAIGDQDVRRESHSTSRGKGGGTRSVNQGWTRERIVSVSDLVALPQWRAFVIGAGDRPALLRLIPYWERDAMKDMVAASISSFIADHPTVQLADEQAEVDAYRPPVVAVDAA